LRAGLIIGGLFLMFIGIVLFASIIFIAFGILCGLIGFVMLIVGLATSSNPKQVVYNYPSQSPTVVYPPQNPQYIQSMQSPNQVTSKYCTACGTPNSKDNQFCGKCGKKFLE
jgi:predicted lipid-binding transport protein (Tim44 family)